MFLTASTTNRQSISETTAVIAYLFIFSFFDKIKCFYRFRVAQLFNPTNNHT